MLGWMSPYVSLHCLRQITRFGLTSEGGIWVTCFGLIMIHELPTTMYFVPFTLFLPYIEVLRVFHCHEGWRGAKEGKT
ncbi:hypothetical protein BGY98DRAFT_1046110 [Russula aff. rugulosa BPL654]|nr:hypothetical protein BGY98DRAFT_1046110 [Russula aff. rugulosa BPL654]